MEPPPPAAICATMLCRKKYTPLNCRAHKLVQFGLRDLEQLGHGRPAGAIDGDVEAAEALRGEAGEGCDLGAARDVADAVISAQFFRQRLELRAARPATTTRAPSAAKRRAMV
jgi:hypothetical protein